MSVDWTVPDPKVIIQIKGTVPDPKVIIQIKGTVLDPKVIIPWLAMSGILTQDMTLLSEQLCKRYGG